MDRLLAGRTPTGAGPFWLVTVARYHNDEGSQEAAARYADWFARGVPPLLAVGGKVVLRLIDADVNVTVVELPSPAALQAMQAKYEYVKRGPSPAALSGTFVARCAESDTSCERRIVECDAGNMYRLTAGGGLASLFDFDFFSGPLSLKLFFLRGMDGVRDQGYAEISDGVQYGALFSSRQMYNHGRL